MKSYQRYSTDCMLVWYIALTVYWSGMAVLENCGIPSVEYLTLFKSCSVALTVVWWLSHDFFNMGQKMTRDCWLV